MLPELGNQLSKSARTYIAWSGHACEVFDQWDTVRMHMLATPDHEAYFDFCSNVIQLKVYDSSYRDEFQRAISWEPGDSPLSHREADFRALLKHEVTHFLDVSTTAWGRQYSYRKLRFIRFLREQDPAVEDARKVFAIESGEIELHSSLVRAGYVPPTECEAIQNQLIYTEEYGTCLLLHYLRTTTSTSA